MLSFDLDEWYLDFNLVESKITAGLSDNMNKTDFINYQAETLAYLNINHPDYAKLACWVLIQELHKNTFDNLSDYVNNLYQFKEKGDWICSLLNEETYQCFKRNINQL